MIGVCLATAALSACASDPGEKVVEAPFPKLAEVPPRPEAETTPEERAALKQQLEHRREEINRAAASLLRGGTEPVPVALDSQVPEAPSSRRARTAPPPLPAGLPQPPERPEFLSDGTVAVSSDVSPRKKTAAGEAELVIDAPEKAEMPPAKAAGEPENSDEAGDAEDKAENDG